MIFSSISEFRLRPSTAIRIPSSKTLALASAKLIRLRPREMADYPEPDKPNPVRRIGKFGNDPSPEVHVPPEASSSLGRAWGPGPPWEWHITETFKGLISLAVELVKMLALVNGGAIVALLAYLGNFAAHAGAGQHPPHLRHAFGYFVNGLVATLGVVIVAYLTQLKLYNEELRHHIKGEKPFPFHAWILAIGMVLAVYAAIAFCKGCLSASTAIGGARG